MLNRHLLWIFAALLLHGCAMPKQIDVTEDWSASRFYSEAKAAKDDGDYEKAIEYLQKLEARYPFGRFAIQAQLDIIHAHYKNGEPDSAIAAADRFIRLQPQNPYVDYAYYMKGLVNYNRDQSFSSRFLPTDPTQRDAGATLTAFNDFTELVKRFPESRYATDARQRMLYLRNNLARYQLHVAEYYMKRGAYMAAANRANRVVTGFQRTDAVRDALEIMIEAYTRLGMDTLAQDARRVLALNLENGRLPGGESGQQEDSGSTFWRFLNLD